MISNYTSSQLRKHLKFSFINKIRAFYHSFRLGKLGNNVFIDKDVSLLRFPKNILINNEVVLKKGVNICSCNNKAIISIGERTTVGFYTFIYASEGIRIGNDCLIAPFVYIVDSDHSIELGTNINLQLNKTAEIIIEDDVWIATGAKILKGVTIGKGSVIAAGALVKEDVAPNSIVGGIPAKLISKRE
ncbi:acyltransferase [Maribacter sp. CXY002]|uniref:acyltransferase n=1 Tax=Maribacter luteocoastalis TaxID=3407671 RepID=UPI003B6807B8